MYVDLWGWFRNYELTALLKGDALGRRLVTLARDGWRYRENADPERAIQAFKEGVALAEHLNEPWWKVFHQYWIAEIMFYLKHDYQSTLDYIVRLTSECRKELYDECPVRSRVFFVLANIYYMIDFYGYQPQITEVLDYIENHIQMDQDTHMRVLHMRAQIAFDHDNYDSAEAQVHDVLNQSQDNDFRQRSAYHMLRALAYARGNIKLAVKYAEIAEQYALRIQIQRSIAEGKLWLAVYHYRLGDALTAESNYKVSLDHYERYNIPKEMAYHEISAEYKELQGDTDTAQQLLETLITQVSGSASVFNQMMAHWSYCRLLGRLGNPLDEALKSARAVGDLSRDPTIYLQKLDEIEQGKYHEFDWQQQS